MTILTSVLGAALVATSYNTVNAQDSRFTYFDLETPLASPCDLFTGPDGDIYASTFTADKLVHIDRDVTPNTFEEIDIPYKRDQLPLAVLPSKLQGLGACVVQPGNDGNVYLATGIRNELVQYNPETRKFKFYENTGGSLGNLQPFNDMWPGTGGMWFTQTTANVLTFFDFATEKMTSYDVPTPLSMPIGVIVVPNGDVWFCEFTGQKMAKFDPKTEEFTEYPVPLGALGPGVVRAFTDDKFIWYTALASNAIGRVDINTGEMKAFPNNANLGIPIEDTNDGNGNIWFSTALSNTLNYLTPRTGKVTEIPQPGTGLNELPLISLPPAVDISMHWVEDDNSMWFTEFANNRIGRYQLTGNEGLAKKIKKKFRG